HPAPRLSPSEVGITGSNDRHPLALFVGDIRSPRKNLDSVLHALARVPDLTLIVVGKLERSPFPHLAQKLNIPDRVIFLGYRPDVSRLMRAADFFLSPSRYEPFGLVVLEALASGLPVITASTVGAAALVTPNCGRVIPDPHDIDSLAVAL